MASARRLAANIFSTWFANIVKVVIQLVMLPLMANLLGPKELGLYALALPIMNFVGLLSDGGLGDSLAREKTTDPVVWSSAFWGLLSSGIILAFICYGASFLIGGYAGQPRLPMIMLPLSLTLLMVAATAIPSALMLRSGRSGLGAIGDLIGYITGAVVAIAMAFNGFGVWSMVAQYCVTFFVRMVAFNFFQPFLPKLAFDLKALISHWGIGGAILGGRLADLAGRSLENSQVSRMLGAAALGTYSYANQVPRFVSEAVSNPIWHNLYYLCFSGAPENIAKQYIRHSRMIALIVFPAATLLAVGLPWIVPLLLGPEWDAAIFPMALLLLTYPFMALGNQTGAVLYAQGNGGIPLWAAVLLSVVRVAIVAIAGLINMHAVAIGLAISNLVYWVILTVYCRQFIGSSLSENILALTGPFLASIVAGAGLHFMLGAHPSVFWLIGAGVIGFMIYVAALFVVDRTRVMTDVEAVRGMIVKKEQVTVEG